MTGERRGRTRESIDLGLRVYGGERRGRPGEMNRGIDLGLRVRHFRAFNLTPLSGDERTRPSSPEVILKLKNDITRLNPGNHYTLSSSPEVYFRGNFEFSVEMRGKFLISFKATRKIEVRRLI